MADVPVTDDERLGEGDLPELYRSGRAKRARAGKTAAIRWRGAGFAF